MNWMKNIKKYVSTTTLTTLVIGALFVFATPVYVSAQSQDDINQRARGQACDAIGSCSGGEAAISEVVKTVINILSAIGGIIAVILIIIGGVKYMTSGGDSNSAANARNTIIYAIVGLIIVVFAQVIVRFVLQQI